MDREATLLLIGWDYNRPAVFVSKFRGALQRHLLAHREGLVDQEYIDKSQDTTYRPGQKLIIREAAVLRLAGLVERLAAELKALVAAAMPNPPTAASS